MGLQSRDPYQKMLGVEDGTRGADAIKLRRATSKARCVQRETETNSMLPVGKGWEASADGWIYLSSMTVKHCSFC